MSRLRHAVPIIVPAIGAVICLVLYFSNAISAEAALILLAIQTGVIIFIALQSPFAEISDAAMALAAGDLTARVRPRPSGEAGNVADSINLMAENIQESMLRASQEQSRLAAAMNSSVDAVLAFDQDGKVLFANLAAEALFQHSSADMIGRPFTWIAADESIQEAFRLSRDRSLRQISLVEWPARQYLQVVTTPIRGGGDWAVLAVFHDLTDVRRTELMRRDFVANVSHELRTPLASIKAVIETLADGAIEDSQVSRDFLYRADGEVDRLIQLVEELLELSRIESGALPLTKRSTDVAALLADVVQRLRPQAERKRQALLLDVKGELPLVEVDPVRIERAVLNLLHNAIKFTPDEGTITVSTQRDEGGLRVRVSDSGLGIDSADLPRVFERFYKVDQSRATGGSGLGLALVKHAIEAHGGKVQVESRLGQGTTFSFTIPV